MLLDYSSLLMSIGFSALCLAVVLFLSSLAETRGSALLTATLAGLAVAGSVFTYSHYIRTPSPWAAAVAFTLLLTGMALLLAGARQFRVGASPARTCALSLVPLLPVAIGPFFAGYDGVGFIIVNLATALLLGLCAVEYWRARGEAPVAASCLIALYLLVAASFAACGGVLIAEGNAVLTGPPHNWAENLNAIAVVAGVPGIGALTLAISQARTAQMHRREAMIDQLSGLLNRRALFEAIQQAPPGPGDAVIAFDLDRFKAINDAHGHGIGDRAILLFGETLRSGLRANGVGPGDLAARTGGEEFALVLRQTGAEAALARVEEIRRSFAARALEALGIPATASAGIAFSEPHGGDFQAILRAADQMLYAAKRGGRDGVQVSNREGQAPMLRLVSDIAARRPASRS